MVDAFDAKRFRNGQERRDRHLANFRNHPVTARDKRTTPRPIVDLAGVVPELAGMDRTTVRLHPRYGDEPEPDESKLGGRFIWPEMERWPCCELHGIAYVTVLQLRQEDIPEMEFRPETDLFQLLWCPRDHATWTDSKVFWRRRARVRSPIAVNPFPEKCYPQYVPVPCRLMPERVIEYPYAENMSEDIKRSIGYSLSKSRKVPGRKLHDKTLGHSYYLDYYHCSLASAPGTKVGGYAAWIQGDKTPTCQCGTRMEHLLTVASCEFDAGTAARWMPTEDREIEKNDPSAFREMSNTTGLLLGDLGNIYYFICRHCPDWRIRHVAQCD